MGKFLFLLALFLVTLLSYRSFAEENWKFIKDAEYCFIQSIPSKTEIPEGKSRGKHGVLVYKIHKSSEIIVQITAGFEYRSEDSISVKIDKSNYDFYTDSDTAWASEDKKVIYAMKKGLELIITSISSKGTKVIDTYSLKGFTSGINKISNDC